jgi:inhibitor of cysteine peptidase
MKFTMRARSSPPCPRSPLRHLACVSALIALIAPAAAQESRTVRLAAGASTTISLSENPSTGYRWQLNTQASRNLAFVTVADAGFAAGASGLLGAPGTRRFSITGRQPGTAVAVFDYRRSWEHVAAIRRHIVTIAIGAR